MKPQFLSNPEIKHGLVSYPADKLNAVPGVLCPKADDDADCLIVLTALGALGRDPSLWITQGRDPNWWITQGRDPSWWSVDNPGQGP